ncbi:MAG: helix-turn-helix domain-containing protein [Eubacteriales bacterium]|nr:helix-turn-helix domain-containing protein [Eubacteriales bacterium]
MEKYFELKCALEYIEQHILDSCTQEEIARAACVSLSSLQKLFRYVFNHSVGEHITKRKMTLAGEELLSGSASVAELAAKYGYSSTEAFSRAFRKVNCCLPSDYRRGHGAQSAFSPPTLSEEGVSWEAPALLQAMRELEDCFVICFDIAGMKQLNALSWEAGDQALVRAAELIHAHKTGSMRLFRIGGDEFALVTPFRRAEQAQRLVDAVLAHNGESFLFKGQAVPLCLWGWYGRNTAVSLSPDPIGHLHSQMQRSRIE